MNYALKYVFIAAPDGGEIIVMCLGPETHENIARKYVGCTPVSAAFVRFDEGGQAEVSGRSNSLDLGPRASDERFLTAFARATALSASSSAS